VITDIQVKKLRKLLGTGMTLRMAALKSGMTEPTARRYRAMDVLPSECEPARTWRTREDPFEEAWPRICELLEVEPGLQAVTILEWLKRESPDKYDDSSLRTLQRRLKRWRATAGPPKEVMFSQTHHPGDLCASDFTHLSSLSVTIGRQPYDHLAYHFVLTYSNWECVTLCHSESFESLSEGLQQALWKLKGVPRRHRSDRLSAAVNNLSEQKEFTQRYRGLMEHYGLAMEKIQPREPHENGDVESLHGHFKTAIDQALMLRGSRDFADVASYAQFVDGVMEDRNRGRRKRFLEEIPQLRSLPQLRLPSFSRVNVRVNTGSLIHVQANAYSVDSRLIGEKVDVRIYPNHLEVWYAQRRVDQFPRLRGRGKHRVNYRHVIDSLVRKPGAFENYRYREELFPTSRFRMAYDQLRESRTPKAAVREYLEILCLAARESEAEVDDALRRLLATEQALSLAGVQQGLANEVPVPPATDVTVCQPDLASFDLLFDDATFFA